MSSTVLAPTATIRDAIAAIEQTRRLIVAIVDGDGRLLGVASDGDIRRAILADLSLDAPATTAMTVDPIKGLEVDGQDAWVHQMLSRGVAAIPIIDAGGHFRRIVQIDDFLDDATAPRRADSFWGAVIMAGGEGRRLLPFTTHRPKPMIEIGGVPLLERQVRGLVAAGLRHIYISTNYLGHVIEGHFGDGSAFDAHIRYLREKDKLGTAGSLSLLPERPAGPLLVMNGDVLTTSDYGRLFAYHEEHKAFITVGVINYRVEIPFGVVRVEGTSAVALEEKPSQSFLCNAGIYALSPEALDQIPPATAFNMTDVITNAICAGRTVTVFPIHEYWTDIGNPADLERARQQFNEARHG
jgi:dTDP-glucose pyrophosphorylase